MRREANLVVSDAKLSSFEGGAADFVTPINPLEHVGDPRLALAEVRRTLRPGAWFYVDGPNKTRRLGYLGSPDVSLRETVSWNIIDYHARLRGRFKNELGAHARFEAKELDSLLRNYFRNVEMLTEAYLRFKYGERLPYKILHFLLAPRVINYSAPLHYAPCQKI